MIKVKKGQDPYSVIGQYIRDHVLATPVIAMWWELYRERKEQ